MLPPIPRYTRECSDIDRPRLVTLLPSAGVELESGDEQVDCHRALAALLSRRQE